MTYALLRCFLSAKHPQHGINLTNAGNVRGRHWGKIRVVHHGFHPVAMASARVWGPVVVVVYTVVCNLVTYLYNENSILYRRLNPNHVIPKPPLHISNRWAQTPTSLPSACRAH